MFHQYFSFLVNFTGLLVASNSGIPLNSAKTSYHKRQNTFADNLLGHLKCILGMSWNRAETDDDALLLVFIA